MNTTRMRTLKIITILSLAIFSNCIIVPTLKESDPKQNLYWCPPLPNCASTESSTFIHNVKSFDLLMPIQEAWPIIIETLKAMPCIDIDVERHGYAYARFHTRVFRFIDYFEVLFMPKRNELSVRSSAMLGITDFWVNYRRVERFRERLEKKGIIKKHH